MARWSESLRAYGEAWNEPDREVRLSLLRSALTGDARYTDPKFDVRGIERVSEVIGAYHARYPGFRIRDTSAVDDHHDCLRFTWQYETGGEGPEAIHDGADTILVAGDGRLQRICVFDGASPPRA